MRSHRRKWGWWLVAAIAVVLAASLLYHRYAGVPSTEPAVSAPDSLAEVPGTVPVVRDTVYVKVDGETVPIVRERPSELSADRPGEASAPASAETVVSIPVTEISGLIRHKSGRDITLRTKAPDHIDVSYSGEVDLPLLGGQNVDFTAGFKVVEVQGNRMVLQMDSGTAMNIAADLVAPLVLERLPAGLVDSYSNGRAVVNLSAIPQFRQRLSGLVITGVSVDEGNIRFTTVPKP